MGLFGTGKHATNPKKMTGGFTVTGAADGKRTVKVTRLEWTTPRKGDLANRASKRPRQ